MLFLISPVISIRNRSSSIIFPDIIKVVRVSVVSKTYYRGDSRIEILRQRQKERERQRQRDERILLRWVERDSDRDPET